MEIKENRALAYIKSARTELKKVTWPTRKQTLNYTLLIIGISLGVALFLGLLDYLFAGALSQVIK
jgi:preprotein translocase subunit SecE